MMSPSLVTTVPLEPKAVPSMVRDRMPATSSPRIQFTMFFASVGSLELRNPRLPLSEPATGASPQNPPDEQLPPLLAPFQTKSVCSFESTTPSWFVSTQVKIYRPLSG